MIKCPKCNNENYVKAGFRKTVNGEVQKYKCKGCNKEFTGVEKFYHLNENEIKLISKMYKEKGEQRKIARVLGVHLGTVQHHLKKTLPNS